MALLTGAISGANVRASHDTAVAMMETEKKAIERAIDACDSQQKLADAIGVTQSLVSQWLHGAPIHPRHFKKIESATGGAVTVEELLKDEIDKYESVA